MDELLVSLFGDIANNARAGGFLAVVGILGVIVSKALRIYRSDLIQSILPNRLQWDGLKTWVKYALPMGLSLVGATLGALVVAMGGGSLFSAAIGPALAVGVSAGFGAIGYHHGTKKVGKVIDGTMLTKDPGYKPGPLRKIVSAVAPISVDRLKDWTR